MKNIKFLLIFLLIILLNCKKSDHNVPNQQTNSYIPVKKNQNKVYTKKIITDISTNTTLVPVIKSPITAESKSNSILSEPIKPPKTFEMQWFSIGLKFNYLFYFNSNLNHSFKPLQNIGLFIWAIGPKNIALQFEFYYSSPKIIYNSPLSSSLNKITFMNMGGDVRYYFLKKGNFLDPFLGLGFHYINTHMIFNDPFIVNKKGSQEFISEDNMSGYKLFITSGIDFIRIKHLSLSLNTKIGFSFFNSQSDSGFKNDIFPSTGMLETGLDIGF